VGVKEDLQQLEQQIKQYREQLYGRYNELFNKLANKNRLILNTFKNYVAMPSLINGYVLGKEVLIPQTNLDTVVEPKINWAGATRWYEMPHSPRNYELISVPVFEFDPVSDAEALKQLSKELNAHRILQVVYCKLDIDVDIEPTMEDALFKYVFCDKTYDHGRLDEDYELPETWCVYGVTHNGKIFRLNKVLEGARWIHAYYSKFTVICMDIFFGDVELEFVNDGTKWTETSVFLRLGMFDETYENKYVWMFGDKELKNNYILIRKSATGLDAVMLLFEGEANAISALTSRPEWLWNMSIHSASSLLFAVPSVSQFRKTVTG